MEKWNEIYKQIEKFPDDFALWQDLVDCIKQGDDTDSHGQGQGLCKASSQYTLQLFRFTYDGLLARFPLLEYYWIEYAEQEFKLSSAQEAERIYARAIAALPYSVIVWSAYAKFTILTRIAHPDIARETLELGASKIGSHFLAHMFWDQYIQFETLQDNPTRIGQLLVRIMAIPLHQYAKYFDMFRKLVQHDMIPLESQAPPLVVQQLRAEYEMEQGVLEQNDDNLKKRLAAYHETLYNNTSSLVNQRFTFEKDIKRPYFDVMYITESEMRAWRRYLDFEEPLMDINRIHSLYQRALIATAYNEELWLRYVRWLVGTGQVAEAKNVLRRASVILPIGRPAVRLYFARLLASEGDIEAAQQLCQDILVDLPNCLEVCICLAKLYRSTSVDACKQFLERFIGDDSELQLDEKVELLALLADDCNTARELDGLFRQYLSGFEQNVRFWRTYLELMIEREAPKSLIDQVYDIMNAHLSDPLLKKELSHIYLASTLASINQDAARRYIEIDQKMHLSPPIAIK